MFCAIFLVPFLNVSERDNVMLNGDGPMRYDKWIRLRIGKLFPCVYTLLAFASALCELVLARMREKDSLIYIVISAA